MKRNVIVKITTPLIEEWAKWEVSGKTYESIIKSALRKAKRQSTKTRKVEVVVCVWDYSVDF